MTESMHPDNKARSSTDMPVYRMDEEFPTRPLNERPDSTLPEKLKYDQFIKDLFMPEDDIESETKEEKPAYWSEVRVLQWLESEGYGFLRVLFKRRKINGARLGVMDEDDLRDLKVPKNLRKDLHAKISELFRDHYGDSLSSRRSSTVSTEAQPLYHHLLHIPNSRSSINSTRLGSSDCSYLYDDLKSRPFQLFNPKDPMIMYYLNRKRSASRKLDVGCPVHLEPRASVRTVSPEKGGFALRKRSCSMRVLDSRERKLLISAVQNGTSSPRRVSTRSLNSNHMKSVCSATGNVKYVN